MARPQEDRNACNCQIGTAPRRDPMRRHAPSRHALLLRAFALVEAAPDRGRLCRLHAAPPAELDRRSPCRAPFRPPAESDRAPFGPGPASPEDGGPASPSSAREA